MRMLRHWLGAGLIAIAGHGYAGPHVTGTFEAVRACEAYKSFKKGQNPGNVKLAPGQTYEALEVNNTPWHWIRVIVPDSDFAQRWVSKACGIAAITLDEPHAAGGGGSQRGSQSPRSQAGLARCADLGDGCWRDHAGELRQWIRDRLDAPRGDHRGDGVGDDRRSGLLIV